MKNYLLFGLKLLVAGVLIYFLFRSGKMDMYLLANSLNNPGHWIAALTLFIVIILLASYRWKTLLEIKSSTSFPYFRIVRLTWIGLLFNTVLPGAVSGDLIKLVYARDIDPKLSKTYLITSVLIDRIFGLFGLICVLGIFSLMSYQDLIIKSKEVKSLIHLNFLIFAGMCLFLIIMFSKKSFQETVLGIIRDIPIIGNQLHKTLSAVWDIGGEKKVVFKTIFISSLCHFLAISAFYLVSSPYFSQEIPWKHLYTFVPIGLFTIAIPITPAGLGIGHHAFGKLFSLFGINNGVALFNFYFVCQVIINTLGIIPYLLQPKKNNNEGLR